MIILFISVNLRLIFDPNDLINESAAIASPLLLQECRDT